MLRNLTVLMVLALSASGCSPAPSPAPGAAQDTTGDAVTSDRQSGDRVVSEDVRSRPPTASSEAESRTGAAVSEDGDAREARPSTAAAGPKEDPELRAQVLQYLEDVASEAALERRAASDALDALGERAIPCIVMGLQQGSQSQRQGAATYLIGRVTPRDQEAIEALITALGASDSALRRAALQAVEKLDPAQLSAALPQLLAYAQNAEEAEAYRSRAVRAVTKLGPEAATAVPVLKELARDDQPVGLRRACLFGMSKIATAEQAEEFYQQQLQENAAADLRRLSAKWLAGVATTDTSLACLIKAFEDEDDEVRLEAVNTLVAIGKPSLAPLVEAMKSDNVMTRRHATLAIGKLGLLAQDVVPDLRARLDDPDPQTRELARAALEHLQ